MQIQTSKHCFFCQSVASTTRNPLKETEGGNFMHKNCAVLTAHITNITFKRKTRSK